MFAGDTIPGLLEAINKVFAERRLRLGGGPSAIWMGGAMRDTPTASEAIELDDLVIAVEQMGVAGPVREHIEWLVVNDPRVVRNGKRVRSFQGT